jgi:hypothetical protein
MAWRMANSEWLGMANGEQRVEAVASLFAIRYSLFALFLEHG